MFKKTILIALFFIALIGSLAAQTIKVACIGNSITYGLNVENREVNAYPAQLQHMLGDSYIVENFGKSGATLLNQGHRPYTQQDEYSKALTFAPDIVVIHLGINDTDPRNWTNYRDNFVKDYLQLIDSFKKINPDARVIVARMTPITSAHPRFESGTRDWHQQIQQDIETVASISKAQLIDFFEPLYSLSQLLPDAIHPNAEGAKILAKTVYSAITGDFGGLQMPLLFSDDMILPHNQPIEIQGFANAGEKISVSIARQKMTTTALDNGKWKITLQPLKADNHYTLSISSPTRKLVYKNVAAGEIWLASGQSNMEFTLNQSATGKIDIPLAQNENIRLFDMKGRWQTGNFEWNASALDSVNHLQYFHNTKWEKADIKKAAQFSAIGYYFAKILQDSLHIPVGIICNAVGGSPIESWVNRWDLEYHLPSILRDWKDNDFLQDWVRGRAKKNMGENTSRLQRHPYEPAYLFDAGIRVLEKFPIKGVIWYQGESNAHNREAHAKLFQLLVNGWRNYWNCPEMPFYYVQLSGMDRPSWTWFRDSQRRLQQKVPNTAMVVSSDLGDSLNVHPAHKKQIGERLARIALNKTYGFTHIIPSGPLYKSVRFKNGSGYVNFDNDKGLKTSDGKAIRTFEVSEYEGLFYPAKAEIVGNEVKVSAPEVKNPRFVRYGWQPFTRANLVNEDNLPASTFTSQP